MGTARLTLLVNDSIQWLTALFADVTKLCGGVAKWQTRMP